MLPKTACSYLLLALLFLSTETLRAQEHWVGSWATAQQRPEPQNSLAADDLRDATLRQIVHLSLGGNQIRLRLSNRFGSAPFHISSVHVAVPASRSSGAIKTDTDRAVRFSGSLDVTIPAGADYVSDPLAFSVSPLSDLAITVHIDAPPQEQTGHPGSRETSFLARGDLVSAANLLNAQEIEHWYCISGIDVVAPREARAIVTLGDSITDGHGATTNGNDRWPDVLAKRLQSEADTRDVAVLNHGIGGNRLLLDGLGPNALARFDDDVIAQTGVRYLLVLEGINDIGTLTRDHDVPQSEHDALIHHMIGAYEQMVVRAHAHGIKVIGATILPFVGSGYYHPGTASEADRQAANQWIRTPGHFDAVVDFDKNTRDPQHPDRLLPAYDSGDHLHPSPAGYAAMAEAIPLSLFVASRGPQLALTFDDLPAHSSLPQGETRIDVATKILAALHDAGAPPIYGFVNGARIEERPENAAVLQAWRAGGNPLGNHGWSHMNLNQLPLEEVEQDVLRDEAVLKQWMNDADWHWFRYPFLAEGETPEKRVAFRNFLLDHGYKVADVTMSFGDYSWNEPYVRCKANDDNAAIASLEESYLRAADQDSDYRRHVSQTLLGRDIPYVLLMHIGAFDAEMLPKLLALYRSKGFELVTLEQAESDEFYRPSVDLHLAAGVPNTLEAAMAEGHLQNAVPANPGAHLDGVCR